LKTSRQGSHSSPRNTPPSSMRLSARAPQILWLIGPAQKTEITSRFSCKYSSTIQPQRCLSRNIGVFNIGGIFH
jgi:hypothetical protein